MKRAKAPEFSWQEIRFVSLKIRGLAYLLANQNIDQCPPLDLDQLYYGMGLVLDEIGQNLATLATTGEETELAREKR